MADVDAAHTMNEPEKKLLSALTSHGKACAPQRARRPRTRGGADRSRGIHRACGLEALRDADGAQNKAEKIIRKPTTPATIARSQGKPPAVASKNF